MSISSSLSNAVSGLRAVSRAAEVVSSNVANSMTEGYGRREVELGSATVGGRGSGVAVIGVNRIVNDAAIADRRLASAAFSYSDTKASLFLAVERSVGVPNEPGSLTAHIDRLDQSLISAAATPSNESHLVAVVNDAISLATKFNSVSKDLGVWREDADRNIGSLVSKLNGALADVDRLNEQIKRQINTAGEAPGLIDQRQKIIDEISDILPIQMASRESSQVVLLTPNGTTLVDTDAAKFSFQPTSVITPDMSLTSGALSGLSITGASSLSGNAFDSIAGGELAAQFEIRDTEIPKLQENLDALAADLIFRTANADPTASPGNPGLFTDNQNLPTIPLDAGVASRMQVNASIDPNVGGETWRIRDGAEALIEGPPSQNSLLTELVDQLGASVQPAIGMFAGAGPSSQLASDFSSAIGRDRHLSEQRQGFEATRVQAFAELEQSFGVDTDQEMQKLLLIEQSFAANAKVIQTVDEMLQSLLRI